MQDDANTDGCLSTCAIDDATPATAFTCHTGFTDTWDDDSNAGTPKVA
jgi:hypothetical protein